MAHRSKNFNPLSQEFLINRAGGMTRQDETKCLWDVVWTSHFGKSRHGRVFTPSSYRQGAYAVRDVAIL
jgi:hypothetical protein